MMNPKIRFKKSDGSDYQDWQQKKLGDFLSTPVKEEVAVTSTNELLTVKLHNGGIKQAEEKALQFGSTKYYKRHAGQFIYGIQNFHNGAMGIIPNDLDGKCSSAFIPSFDIHGIDTSFFDMYVSRPSYYIPKEKYAVGNGSKLIHEKELFEFDIAVPSDIEEQTKIANFLSEIDNLIASAENEVESIKQLKKAMLQKMFPKKGEKVPEIRFPEFTGDWEQRKLGEVFEEYSEKGHEELPPLTIIQGKGTILREESERNLIYDDSGLKNYKLVNEADFILHLRSFEGGLEKANSRGIVSPAYHIFHGENTDSRFYYPFFRSKYFISVLLKPHVYGIRDGKSIDVEGMKSIDIPYPTIEEQNKIGDYFSHLDSLITLHQRKVDAYKKFKKAMMQKMFV